MVNHFKLASSRMNLNFFAIRVKFSNNNLHEDKGGWVGGVRTLVIIWGSKGGCWYFFTIYHCCRFFFLQFLDFPEIFFCTKIDII